MTATVKEWYARWRKIGYRQLWHLHYGGSHEGDKGCRREYDFLLEVSSGWKEASRSERSLRLEAEELLIENGVEPPSERRSREFQEKRERRRVQNR